MMHSTTGEEELSLPRSIVSDRTAAIRLAVAALQGVVLYGLYLAADTHSWPATSAYFFAPLLMVFLVVPVLFVSGAGHLDKRQLWRWMTAATVIVAALALYDIWRIGQRPPTWYAERHGWWDLAPSQLTIFFTAVGLFIGQALVLAGANDGRRIARYPTYFEHAWKLAIQVKFAFLFVGVLWIILWMGASLFQLVNIDAFRKLLEKPWFYIPVTVFAFSMALHVTDVRPGIVRGIRTLLLVLMSWLLPVTTLIVATFLAALPFTGLAALWSTKHATVVLLWAAAVLILLVNASYQSGEVSAQVARLVRIAARVACLLLVPIVAVAAYALALRVNQYGWTGERVIAAAYIFIAGCYSGGYAWAALKRNAWLADVANVNIAMAFVVLATLLSLFSPVLDPARISVNNQLARLASGKTSAASFDFDYLRFDAARYGKEALMAMQTGATGPDAKLLEQGASAALRKQSRWSRNDLPVASGQDVAANIAVWPSGAKLPPSFLSRKWKLMNHDHMLPDCLTIKDSKCDAYLIDLNGDGKAEVALRDRGDIVILVERGKAGWIRAGTIDVPPASWPASARALAAGEYRTVAPEFNDLKIGERRLHVVPR